MSAEMQAQANVDRWENGYDLFNERRELFLYHKEFTNVEGHTLRLEVIGSPEDTETYLGALQLAFRVERLEDADVPSEGALLLEGSPPVDWNNLQIQVQFPYEEPPFRWEVWLDPKINNSGKFHYYKTSKASSITATLEAVSGSLQMGVSGYAYVNAAHGASSALTITPLQKTWFNITIAGFEESNQYNLYLLGASYK